MAGVASTVADTVAKSPVASSRTAHIGCDSELDGTEYPNVIVNCVFRDQVASVVVLIAIIDIASFRLVNAINLSSDPTWQLG